MASSARCLFSSLLLLLLLAWNVSMGFAQMCDGDVNEPNDPWPTGVAPGMGVEFETQGFTLNSRGVPLDEIYDMKFSQVYNSDGSARAGPNFKLTVDSSLNSANTLSPEYIILGQTAKISTGAVSAAAAAVYEDFLDWKPNVMTPPMKVGEEYDYKWTASGSTTFPLDDYVWDMQVTVPMPLEAVCDVFADANTLNNGLGSPTNYLLPIADDFFQFVAGLTNPDKDVMAFFSLILTYVKNARKVNKSPKLNSSIMPRTDFLTIFKLVQPKLASVLTDSDSLYQIVKQLACWNWNSGQVMLNLRYCSANSNPSLAPTPNSYMDTVQYSTNDGDTMSIMDWINGIQNPGPDGDLLKNFDVNFDSQIGGFGSLVENILNTNTPVPLFEFRDLLRISASAFQPSVENVENQVINYHRTYATVADKNKRMGQIQAKARAPYRHLLARQTTFDCWSSTSETVVATPTPSTPTSSTPMVTSPPSTSTISCDIYGQNPDQGITSAYCLCEGSITAPLQLPPSSIPITDEDMSCYYTTAPTSTATITRPTTTWTDACSACTLVGGVADSATCTSVSGCVAPPTATASVYLAVNNTISVGTANSAGRNVTFLQNIINNMTALCTGNFVGAYCNASPNAYTIPDINTLVGVGSDTEEDTIELGFTIPVSQVSNQNLAKWMLATGLVGWQQAVGQSCFKVGYTIIVNDGTDCDSVPPLRKRDLNLLEVTRIQRTTPAFSAGVLEERQGEGVPPQEPECNLVATLCSGPTSFVVTQGANIIEVQIGLVEQKKSAWDEFICEFIVDVLDELALVVEAEQPELLAGITAEDIDFEMLCQDFL
ncbi:hypothetical protein F5Y16DRAFT_417644 [Xylariaceae sp. FL0255]|nr:hypothetical protein F5Y16DRAFT_417644 [Xylariaceae sp. FL0255]